MVRITECESRAQQAWTQAQAWHDKERASRQANLKGLKNMAGQQGVLVQHLQHSLENMVRFVMAADLLRFQHGVLYFIIEKVLRIAD